MEKKKNNNPYTKLQLLREFIKNEDCIVYLLKLRSGNLATCSQDKEINIYEKKTFNLLLSWTGHLNSINSICELNDSRLASCSDDKRVSIWYYNLEKKISFQEIIFIAHESFINKIISLNDDNFATCSEDTNIFIWNSQPPYNKKCSLIGHQYEVTSIIQLKNKKIISTSGNKGKGMMKIWTLNEKNDKIIKRESVINVFCYCNNSLIEINDNKVAAGGYKFIRIVNINRKQIEAIIECHSCLISSMALLNDRYMVSASEGGNIAIINPIFYDIITIIESAHEEIIFSLCTMNKKSFCSSSKDGVIKVWSI